MSLSVAAVSEYQIRRKIEECQQCITKLLNSHKAASFHAADEVQQHTYADKYLLAEQLTTTAAACLVNSLEVLVGQEAMARVLPALRAWAAEQEVSLRFEFEERCAFVRERERDEEDPTRLETEVSGAAGTRLFKSTTKVVRKVKEYVYRFESSYRLVAYRGVYDPQQQQQQQGEQVQLQQSAVVVVLRQKTAAQELVVRNNTPPYVQKRADGRDVNVSWLLRLLDEETCSSVHFGIDRAHAQCHTPYQNPDVQSAAAKMREASGWAQWVGQYLQKQLFAVQAQHSQSKERVDTSAFDGAAVFNPIVPILEDRDAPLGSLQSLESQRQLAEVEATSAAAAVGAAAATAAASPAVSLVVARIGGDAVSTATAAETATATAAVDAASDAAADSRTALTGATVNLLAAEQKRTLLMQCAQMQQLLADASASAIITGADAQLCVVLSHVQQLVAAYLGSVQFIEEMIRKQLVAAIGKVLQPRDFAQYMIFHNRKVLREQYRPQPFSFAIRRSAQHSPEGLVRIELGGGEVSDSTLPEAIHTIACRTESGVASGGGAVTGGATGAATTAGVVRPMHFALNASTKVQFGGDRYVHGWLAHHFHGQGLPQLQLVSQARQFCSFIVLLGRIVSGREFEPKHAFIVQNKDEVQIPLQLERIPTPKEFRDAISSLSPEQQRFAKAFRSMQLESTLFAVCTIQIKPQLEKVLNLAPDSLTKEIKLTQELMKLFIEYQIPSDLLSFDEIAAASSSSAPAAALAAAGGGGAAGGGDGGAGDFEMVSGPSSTGFTSADRLRVVKQQVAAMQQMIDAAKDEEVREKNREREYERGPVMLNSEASFDCFSFSSNDGISRNMWSGASGSGCASFGGVLGSSLAMPSPMPPPMCMNSVAACAPAPPPVPQMMRQVQPQQAQPQQAQQQQQQQQQLQHREQQQQPQNDNQLISTIIDSGTDSEEVDYTKFPTLLDQNYERFDEDSALRPTIISPGATWQKKAQAALLAKPTTRQLGSEEQVAEKQAAFDLLDALTRSGALALEHATLHVVIAATHCFDKSLMDTVVQRNVNPIEKVERSALIMASTLHGVEAAQLVASDQVERLSTYTPALFLTAAAAYD